MRVIPQPHLATAVSALVGGVTAVFASACYVVFYFSCRCKHENFDLEILARSVEADSPPNDEGGVPAGSTGV